MDKKAKCLIVDDEPLAIEVLKTHLSKIDSIEIAGTACDAYDAFNFLAQNKVDLMFLDIHMPEMKGTELIKTLKNPPHVILTTAHRQYALQGYDLNVLDYLLKPISFERFMQAIDKFNAFFVSGSEVSVHRKGTNEAFLYLREKNIIHKIPVSEIVFTESMGDNLKVVTENREINIRYTISSISDILPSDDFLRIHRSFIVALGRITSFSPVSIYIGEKEFPIGTSYKEAVFKRLDYNGFINK
ncbi:response regulator [Maribellus comscasis]|uniref:Response regulator n=1 Tax=Maribellus comscasis TaxID=2681766 RepID=A0A6I6JSC2_9BACT|nr:response regulator transcription factor [Maribellus comscasis]QGY43052.1 response regulator [Maribellus comscasis]